MAGKKRQSFTTKNLTQTIKLKLPGDIISCRGKGQVSLWIYLLLAFSLTALGDISLELSNISRNNSGAPAWWESTDACNKNC